MESKIELKVFYSLNKCQQFINRSIKEKKLIKKDIVPIVTKNPERVSYFVCLEYRE